MGTKGILALGVCATYWLLAAAPAQASFHLIKIREVYPGSVPMLGTDAYVELQAYSSGQNLLSTHTLTGYDNAGAPTGSCPFSGPVANSADQMAVLIADSAGPANADLSCSALQLAPSAGAVCWGTDQPVPPDCMSWGSFSGSLGSPTGTPASSPPPGMALRRSISAGCATLLEASDDTNNSAADFSVTTPLPRNNAAPITETACAPGVGVGGDPNTTIKKRPKDRSADNSPTFKFRSDEVNSTFKCKLDHKKFHKCKSPKTYHGVAPGKHTFKVEAIDADGNVDPTPAKDKFKVLP